MIRDQMEKIYNETPPTDIPWNTETPPKALDNQEEWQERGLKCRGARRFAVIWRKRGQEPLSSVIRLKRPGDHLLLIPKRE